MTHSKGGSHLSSSSEGLRTPAVSAAVASGDQVGDAARFEERLHLRLGVKSFHEAHHLH